MSKIVVVILIWLIGAYAGYTLRPPKVIERYVKVICIPDSETDAKPGDSIEFKVKDWIEFKFKVKTEQIKHCQ